jgi:hypothetical protein
MQQQGSDVRTHIHNSEACKHADKQRSKHAATQKGGNWEERQPE